eukprot:TRINITY_DN1170_c0_g1_i1.p3 TRINITY_DN1170_c0_g1~~TRINITY_DN1170_c0_g1_i1.p3  ORF type:complete len:340 (-),score=18.53 TRINITY_DN1170_c0_g1_i1:765-1754(-)
MTMRKALALLVEDDLLYRVKGCGTFIKKHKSAVHEAFYLNGFYAEVKAQGKTPTTDILVFEVLEPDSLVASKLQIGAHEQVYHIERLRMIDGEPEMLERTYLPLSLFSDLSVAAMRGSKYQYIEAKGMKIAQSRQRVMPEIADKKISKLLAVKEGSPLLKVLSVGELDNGTIFEYSVNYFKLNQYRFEFIAKRPKEVQIIEQQVRKKIQKNEYQFTFSCRWALFLCYYLCSSLLFFYSQSSFFQQKIIYTLINTGLLLLHQSYIEVNIQLYIKMLQAGNNSGSQKKQENWILCVLGGRICTKLCLLYGMINKKECMVLVQTKDSARVIS